jgi:hypothetical protein
MRAILMHALITIAAHRPLEARTIRYNGPADTSVDLVFLAEEYLLGEKLKFYGDVNRLVDQVFVAPGSAFESYFPLFNVHAVFVESATSGVGRGKAKNTAFRLFREGEVSLRSILPPPNSYTKARRYAASAPGADFIVLLVNDELYGGLGDAIAIISASQTSGALALRHELGHNFMNVGEEYDAGGDYSGRNFAASSNVCGVKGRNVRESLVADGEGDVSVRNEYRCLPRGAWLSRNPAEEKKVSRVSV